EPCGPGNPAPVFGVRGARAVDARRVGTNHLRFTLDDRSGALPAIAFEWADAVPRDWLARPLDVAFRLERDEWQGRAGGAQAAQPVALPARGVALAPSGGPDDAGRWTRAGGAPCRVPRSALRVPRSALPRGAGPGMIRIIAGEFKGRRLKTPATTAIRPTADRVREAWFSILQRAVRGARVLDLFAGSGALGLEALSRGAVWADFVEVHRLALAALKANIKALKVEDRTAIHRVDALK